MAFSVLVIFTAIHKTNIFWSVDTFNQSCSKGNTRITAETDTNYTAVVTFHRRRQLLNLSPNSLINQIILKESWNKSGAVPD